MKTRSDHRASGEAKTEEVQRFLQDTPSGWLGMRRFSWQDILILFVLSMILLGGFTQQLNSDAARYQCYAFAFWHGTQALQTLPTTQCSFITHPSDQTMLRAHFALIGSLQRRNLPEGIVKFIATQSSTEPFHVLPYEYPLLAVLSFSPALIVPSQWYQEAFAFWMLCIATSLYLLLLYMRSRGTALTFATYLAVGCFVTALGRFDLIPTAFTFGALLCAERARWRWGFLLLALATMIKFYPVVLLIPLVIVQQRQRKEKWYTWQRYMPPGIFISTCIAIAILSLAVNVEGTIAPLTYFGQRPLQIESVSASLVWLISTIGHYPLTYAFSFGSRNVFSQFSAVFISSGSILFLVGLCFIYWLQWRKKIGLALTFLLTLLVVIITGKVFSAQYLIWLAPFVAYVGGWQRKWLFGWGSISLVTTLIYPFLYNRVRYPFGSLLPEFYTTIFVRNGLLLLFTCLLLYLTTRNYTRADV